MRVVPAAATILPLVLAALLAGCGHRRAARLADYETIADDPQRDTAAARRHNAKAAKLLAAGQLDEAEAQLRAALASDLLFGLAHNNLGVVYFRQKKLYLAAWEFQYAGKLMPRKAEPRNNLGMVFEAVGKLDEAAKSYEEALEIEPETVDAIANLARLYVRKNRKDARTRELLEKVVLMDTRPQWTAWARERLALMGPGKEAATEPGGKE